jgi:hypothetical protein
MAETIHFGEKFRTALAKYFASKSVTDHAFNHNIDAEFVGSDTVHIYEIATTELNTYNKGANPAGESRFGNVVEVGDHCYTFRMTQDVSMDRSVDRGNNDAVFNIKKAGDIMKAYTDKRIRPAKDRYRLMKWCAEAGIHTELSAAPTKSTIVEQIIDLHSAMVDEDVPEGEGILYIPRVHLKALKLSTEWVGLDSLGGKTLPKGTIGLFDGLAVQPVSTKLFPENCYFAIFVKDAIIAPEKINVFRGIKDSENMDGDRLQYRCKYDAFVMPSMAAGAAVACAKGAVTATPTVAISGNQATLTATEGVIWYTLDGSDPRYQSADAKSVQTGSKVTVQDGDVLRVCAKATNKFPSAATYNKVTV